MCVCVFIQIIYLMSVDSQDEQFSNSVENADSIETSKIKVFSSLAHPSSPSPQANHGSHCLMTLE